MMKPNVSKGLWAGIVSFGLLSLFPALPAAAEEDRAVEQVIVTGSYLKRSAEDSPLTQARSVVRRTHFPAETAPRETPASTCETWVTGQRWC